MHTWISVKVLLLQFILLCLLRQQQLFIPHLTLMNFLGSRERDRRGVCLLQPLFTKGITKSLEMSLIENGGKTRLEHFNAIFRRLFTSVLQLIYLALALISCSLWCHVTHSWTAETLTFHYSSCELKFFVQFVWTIFLVCVVLWLWETENSHFTRWWLTKWWVML